VKHISPLTFQNLLPSLFKHFTKPHFCPQGQKGSHLYCILTQALLPNQPYLGFGNESRWKLQLILSTRLNSCHYTSHLPSA